jgi:putative ABC transport system permease protein
LEINKSLITEPTLMFKNYFKITVRNLQKQKIFAIINISGLSIAIACYILLMLYITNELSFDKFNKNAANIYRVYMWDAGLNGYPATANTDFYLSQSETPGEAMKRHFPDVKNYVRMQPAWGENIVKTNKNSFRENISFADPSLFSVFSFPLKYGDSKTVLRDINDIVLTQSKAKELFGTDNVVGKTVEIQIGTSFEPFKISAVAKDVPAASTIRFDVLGNFLYALKNKDRFIIGNNYHPVNSQTFVQLEPGSNLPANKAALLDLLISYNPNYLSDLKNFGYHWTGDNVPVTLRLQPLLSIHTDTGINTWGFTDYDKIDPEIIWILMAIAAGILLIACINFTTLAIGRSVGRSKEVGVRKVIGAEKKQIIFQFLTESFLFSIISTTIGVALAIYLLPWLNKLSGTDIRFSYSIFPQLCLSLIGVIAVTSLLSGSYPAFVLSGFKPVEVLKNKIRVGGSNWFTKSLVTFQFVLSIVLIVSTIIIFQQTKYMMSKNPGFDKENVVVVDASQTDANKTFPLFKQSLTSNTSIIGVASATAGLGAGEDFLGYSDKGLNADLNIVDADYIKVLGMKLLAGSTFGSFDDSIKPVIINETMMRSLGWSIDNAVGKQIKNFQGRTALVIGVVKNFNYHPLKEVVKNQAFITSPDKGYSHFYVRIKPGDPSNALLAIQTAWNNIALGIPFKYSFLDEDINDYYKHEQTWTSIVASAGGISIFLACLGLLGLAALAAVNRTKEIGVRKVLGATVPAIIILLSKDFLKLITISFIIAVPVAYYFMHDWLQNYADRIAINWWVFAITGISVIIIAFATIGFQSVKTAIANPVKALRSE